MSGLADDAGTPRTLSLPLLTALTVALALTGCAPEHRPEEPAASSGLLEEARALLAELEAESASGPVGEPTGSPPDGSVR